MCTSAKAACIFLSWHVCGFNNSAPPQREEEQEKKCGTVCGAGTLAYFAIVEKEGRKPTTVADDIFIQLS